jgi:hypothetical protein
MNEDYKELEAKLLALEEKVDKIYISVEKTRKYFLTSTIITLVVLILPLIGLLFAIPAFLANYAEITNMGL